MRRFGVVALGVVSVLVVTVSPASGVGGWSGARDGGGHSGGITVVDIGVADSGRGLVELSERGYVVFRQPDPDAGGRFRAMRWYRGETIELTPDLPSNIASYPAAVNERGQVAGFTVDENGPTGVHGFVWDDGTTTPVPDGGGDSAATDVDRHGRVLVNHYEGAWYRAGVWNGSREITSPDVLDGSPMYGVEMNDRGQVVGNALTAGAIPTQAFRWQPGRSPVALGSLGGPSGSEASEINQAGSVLGFSTTPENDQRMFLWRHGRMIDLGTLGGQHTRLGVSIEGRSDRLNERDQVAGTSETASGDLHAFLWTRGRMRDLGTLGGPVSYAFGINDRGQVVGMSETASGELSAFLWQDGTMTDIGALTGTSFSLATAINDRGQVLGLRYDGEFHAVVWDTRLHH